MAFTTITDGMRPSGTQWMANFEAVNNKLLINYTGTAYNTTVYGNSAVTSSYETATIAAADLVEKNYVYITVNANTSTAGSSGPNGGVVTLKIEEKYVGGAYGIIFNNNINNYNSSSYSGGMSMNGTHTFIYTLTANDRTNGIVLKFTSTSTGYGASGGTFTNVQTAVFATM